MDKRNFTRITFQSEAVVKSKDKVLRGEMKDLSLKGMFLKVSDELPVEEPVEVEVVLSGTSTQLSVKIQGEVARATSDGLAIHFRGMNLDSFIHLKNIISYNRGDEEEVMDEFYNFIRFDQHTLADDADEDDF